MIAALLEKKTGMSFWGGRWNLFPSINFGFQEGVLSGLGANGEVVFRDRLRVWGRYQVFLDPLKSAQSGGYVSFLPWSMAMSLRQRLGHGTGSVHFEVGAALHHYQEIL